MSQEDCLQILRKNKNKWLTAKQIHQKLKKKITLSSTRNNLKGLRKYKQIKYKKITIKNKKTKPKKTAYAYKIKTKKRTK